MTCSDSEEIDSIDDDDVLNNVEGILSKSDGFGNFVSLNERL